MSGTLALKTAQSQLSRNPGNGKAMVWKQGEAPQEEENEEEEEETKDEKEN
jgi:hypothetical protein